MRLVRPILALILLLPGVAGCGGGLPAGQAGLKVVVKAEPKAGYTLDVKAADVYLANPDVDDATTARRDPFRPLDYRNLEDIIVYLMPLNGSAAAAPLPPAQVVDAGSPRGRLEWIVSAVGGTLRIDNTASTLRSVYVRSESGTVTDVGRIEPRHSASLSLSVPGSLSVWSETGKAEDDCIAEVFVAPNGWFGKTVSGGRVTIAPVPPGRYMLHTWHWRLPGTQQPIELQPDKYTEATAAVTVNVLPPPDRTGAAPGASGR